MYQTTTIGDPVDEIFCLNKLGGPLCSYAGRPIPTDAARLVGKFSYQDQWAAMYTEALVTGSVLRLTIRRPVHPDELVPMSATVNSSSIPVNSVHGFWYVRYRYNRATDVAVPPPHTVVGHPLMNPSDVPVRDSGLWNNMRDFMTDPTVTWVRDHVPKVTEMSYTLRRNTGNFEAAVPLNVAATYNMADASGTDPSDAPTTYTMQMSHKPVTLVAAFSLRGHTDDLNYMRNAQWQDLSELTVPECSYDNQAAGDHFFVKLGYIGFDETGRYSFTLPIDRIRTRNVSASLMYKVHLRSPKIEPWAEVPNLTTDEKENE